MFRQFAILVLTLAGAFGANYEAFNSKEGYFIEVQANLGKNWAKVSETCRNHTVAFLHGLVSGEKWAVRMFDASSKIPSGIMDGNLVDLGFFDECIATEGNLTSTDPEIFGKHCMGTFPLESALKLLKNPVSDPTGDFFHPNPRVLTPDNQMGIQSAFCVPQSCSAADLNLIFDNTFRFYDSLCQAKSDKPPLDAGAITTLSFLGVILGFVVASTIYDTYLYFFEQVALHPLLIAFSVLSNGRKILKVTKGPDQISCLHGIRVISTMWVILGHRYALQATFPLRNTMSLFEWMNSSTSMFLLNAPLSVDTFFLMSGLVVSYIYMMATTKGVKFNILLYYLHRYLRLTPVLAVIILIHAFLITHLGSGPLYPQSNVGQAQACQDNWWKVLLYIQNYGEPTDICIPQSWYVNVDTQLFLISPLILVPLRKWPIATLLGTGILTLLSTAASFATAWILELNSNVLGSLMSGQFNDYMQWYYFATHTRAAPWFMGIILGYYIFEMKKGSYRVRLNKALVPLIWIMAIVIMSTCLFAGHSIIFGAYDRWVHSIHIALVRPTWAVGLSWVIVACVIGYGGPINWFLSLPIFQVLSKFTYTLYLLHFQIITMLLASMRASASFSNAEMMYTFWGDFALTLTAAVIMTLFFESPIVVVEQLLFGRRKQQPVERRPALEFQKSVEPPV